MGKNYSLGTESEFKSPLSMAIKDPSINRVIEFCRPSNFEKGYVPVPQTLKDEARTAFRDVLRQYEKANYDFADYFLHEFMPSGYDKVDGILVVKDYELEKKVVEEPIDITQKIAMVRAGLYDDNLDSVISLDSKLRKGVGRFSPRTMLIEYIGNGKYEIEKLVVRTKSPDEIFEKVCEYIFGIRKKQKDLIKKGTSGISDISGIRFVSRNEDHCYGILSYLQEPSRMFKIDTSTIKDYIKTPKANGYKSIHVNIVDNLGFIHNVQIRTSEMDLFAKQNPDANDVLAKEERRHEMRSTLNQKDKKTYDRVKRTLYSVFSAELPPNLNFLKLIEHVW